MCLKRLASVLGWVLLMGTGGRVFAQVEVYEDYVPEKQHLYMKERFVYATIHTGGVTLGFEQGWLTRRFRYHGWNVEFASQLNAKATSVSYSGTGRSFKYGMLHSVCVVRGGYGGLLVFNEKPHWGGVQVSFAYRGGFSLALAFPQWIYVDYGLDGEDVRLEKMDADNPYHKLGDHIVSRSKIFKGFDGLRPYPGIYAKAGMNFEFGKTEEFSHSLGFGVMYDCYFTRIPLMMREGAPRESEIFNYYDPFGFFNFYLEYKFGMRYGVR